MGNGKPPAGEDPGDRPQTTDPRLAALRAASVGGRATQGKVAPVSFYSYRSGELKQLVAEYEQIHFKPGRKSKATINKLNKLAESIGEVSADIEVQKQYGSSIKERIKIPVRRNGVPVLDLAYELTTGEILIVEAKYNNSLRGRVNDVIIAADDVAGSGAGQKIALKGQTEQLSGRWVKDRVNEVGKHDRRLGNKLVAAIENDKLIVIEHRAKANIDDKAKKIVIEPVAKNETERVTKSLKEGRQPITDKERAVDRKLAKDEGFLREDFKTAKSKSASLKREADNAQKTLKKTLREFESAEKKLKNLGPRSKPETRIKYTTLVDQKRHELADARKAFDAAEKASVQAAEDLAKVSKNLDTVRATQKARFAEQRATQLARMTGERVAGARLTEQSLAGTAGKAEKIAGEAGKIVKVAEETKTFTKFVFKGLSGIKTAGRVVLIGLNVLNPIFDVLLVVDLVDSLFKWLKSDEIEDRKEWDRITSFLLGEPEDIRTIYGTVYRTSQRTGVNWMIEQRLGDTTKNARNILFWLDKWSKEKSWNGFVYAVVDMDLERQEGWGRDAENDLYRIKYIFKGGRYNLEVTDSPPPKYKRASDTSQTAYTTDQRNWTTGGAMDTPRFSMPRYEYNVYISTVFVRLPLTRPVLTPFDFILAKCSALLYEVSTFLSRYDRHVFAGMALRFEPDQSPRPDWLNTIKIDWVDVHDFPYPLNSDNIRFSIKLIYWAIEQLALHTPKAGDFLRENELAKFNAGFSRRSNILFELNRPKYAGKRPFYEVGLRLNNIVSDTSERYLIKPSNSELKYLTHSYLADLAFEIDGDLKRVYSNISDTKSPARRHEFNYVGRI